MQSILEEQFYLAYKANIPVSDSNMLPDFEREIYTNLLLAELKKKSEAMSNI